MWRQYGIYTNDSKHINEPADSDSNYYMHTLHFNLHYHNLILPDFAPAGAPIFSRPRAMRCSTRDPGPGAQSTISLTEARPVSGLNNSHVVPLEELIH